MNILIKNGHIIDPSQGIDGIGDVVIENWKIVEVRIAQKRGSVEAQKKTPPQPPLDKGGD
ncbi:MAG: hypothetical protein IVZ94_01370 [Nitrospirae bacterium]|nr:hypothetical protein [Nitrospirota bacterium]